MSTDELIEKAILRRAARRNVTPGISRYRYSNELLFKHIPVESRKSALYVGIGNGLDAVLALLDNHVTEVVGVDPYIEEDGSDDRDLTELLDLVKQCRLETNLYHFAVAYVILSRVCSRFMLCLPHCGGRRYGQSK
jgi:hypothetical protein